MNEKIFVKPTEIMVTEVKNAKPNRQGTRTEKGTGKLHLVRDPVTRKPLDANGEWKPRNRFWNARLRDGEVAQAAPPQARKEDTAGSK